MYAKKHRYYRPKKRTAPGTAGRFGAHAKRKRQKPKQQNTEINIGFVRTAVLTLFLTVSLGWFVFFFFASDNFLVKEINIQGSENIPENELRSIIDTTLHERRFLLFRNNNMLLISKNRLHTAIAEQYFLEDLNIDRVFPYTVHITIKEKLARLLLRVKTPVVKVKESPPVDGDTPAETSEPESTVETGDIIAEPIKPEPVYTEAYFYLDVNGIVVSEGLVHEDDLSAVPVIELIDSRQTDIKPGEQIITRERITDISDVYDLLSRSGIGVTIAHVRLNQDVEREVIIATSEGWEILIDTNIDIKSQLKKLELVLDEKIKDDRGLLRYVDLRVKDRVYYKFKN